MPVLLQEEESLRSVYTLRFFSFNVCFLLYINLLIFLKNVCVNVCNYVVVGRKKIKFYHETFHFIFGTNTLLLTKLNSFVSSFKNYLRNISKRRHVAYSDFFVFQLKKIKMLHGIDNKGIVLIFIF